MSNSHGKREAPVEEACRDNLSSQFKSVSDLQEAREEIARLGAELSTLQLANAALGTEIKHLERHLRDARQLEQHFRGSTSWRITAPLRTLSVVLSGTLRSDGHQLRGNVMAGPIFRVLDVPSQFWLKIRFTRTGRLLRRLLNHTPFLARLLRHYHLARFRRAGAGDASAVGVSPWAALSPDRENPSVEIILARVEREIEAAGQRGTTR